MAFAEMLDRQKILYEVEKIFLNGDRWVLVDFYFKDRKLAIEIDGSSHDDTKEYDAGRDRWLLERYGVRTVRLSNSLVLRGEDHDLFAIIA
jgi:very-short-patch-repair endonuclease